MFLIEIGRYSKLLFTAVLLFTGLQLFYTLQFARLAKLVDNDKPVPYPIAFEAFPFVVYNMYSGKITDWGHYSCYKIEVDGEPVALTGLRFFESEQISNPVDKFLVYKSNDFNQEPLHSFLLSKLDSSELSAKIYDKVSNHGTKDCSDKWGRWLLGYFSSILGKNVHTVKIFTRLYQYNNKGRPEKLEEKAVFQYP